MNIQTKILCFLFLLTMVPADSFAQTQCLDFSKPTSEGNFSWRDQLNGVVGQAGTDKFSTETFQGRNTLRIGLDVAGGSAKYAMLKANIPPAQSYTLTQSMYFEPGWDWGERCNCGKLGFSFAGGSAPSHGSTCAVDGFASMMSWAPGSVIKGYIYTADRSRIRSDNSCSGWGPSIYENYKQSNQRQQPLPVGQWVKVTQQITSNSAPNVRDGVLKVWYNGKLSYENNNMLWWNEYDPSGNPIMVDKLFFVTGHGTNHPTEGAPVKRSYVRFADVCYSPEGLSPSLLTDEQQGAVDTIIQETGVTTQELGTIAGGVVASGIAARELAVAANVLSQVDAELTPDTINEIAAQTGVSTTSLQTAADIIENSNVNARTVSDVLASIELTRLTTNDLSAIETAFTSSYVDDGGSEGDGLSEAELQALRDETAALIPEPFEGDLAATGDVTDDQLISEWVQAFVMMTDQFSHTMVQQVQAIGQFFDAKHQLETQQLFQQRVARAHKDYQPSEQICEIGTFVRDLADAEERTKITRNVIAQAPISRELGSGLVKTFNGIQESDVRTRRDLYRNTFCNIFDNAQNNELVCGTTAGGPGGERQNSSRARLNADLNYTQTIDLPLTLDVDFTDGVTSDEETNIFAMLDQIFMNTPFPALSSQKAVLHNFVKPYQEMRSLIAIRSVAQNSFAHIIAEKTIGAETENSITPFIYRLLEEMGMNSFEGTSHHGDTILHYLGERPSYYAQMEVLTKKIFQHPEFISNLYDKPANVKRIKTALNAIKLMQDRDIQQAMMRREMLTSMVLELRLRKRQNKLENQVEGILSQPPGEAIDIYGVSGERGDDGDGF